MTTRQEREAHFHDERRGQHARPGSPEYAKYTAFLKWYSITGASQRLARRWIEEHCPGKLVLDFGCGEGEQAVSLAKSGATVVGVDISEVSIQMCKELAQREGVAQNTTFLVGDVEALSFPDGYFDSIWASGILHHLDVGKAYRELARVLKPEGTAICVEALGHNPLINLYRRRTPYLRSEDEHPLLKPDVEMADRFFGTVERRFFHLASLAAVPFRRLPGGRAILRVLEAVDGVILHIPILQWHAWQVALVLSAPTKGR